MRWATFQSAEDPLSSPRGAPDLTERAAPEYSPAVKVRVLGPSRSSASSGESIPLAGHQDARARRDSRRRRRKHRHRPSASSRRCGASRTSTARTWCRSPCRSCAACSPTPAEVDRITTHPTGYQLGVDRDDCRRAALRDARRSGARASATTRRRVAELLGTRARAVARHPARWRSGHGADRRDPTAVWRSCDRSAVEDLVDAELALGQHRRLAPELEALVAEEPLRERRWGQLIRALYGSGRQADACGRSRRARDV